MLTFFLEAELLYKPLCPSVGLLVGWSVGLSVGVQLAFRAVLARSTGYIVMEIDTHTLYMVYFQITYI